jgi:hypothetical protein
VFPMRGIYRETFKRMNADGQREKRMLEKPAETIQCVSCLNRSPQTQRGEIRERVKKKVPL